VNAVPGGIAGRRLPVVAGQVLNSRPRRIVRDVRVLRREADELRRVEPLVEALLVLRQRETLAAEERVRAEDHRRARLDAELAGDHPTADNRVQDLRHPVTERLLAPDGELPDRSNGKTERTILAAELVLDIPAGDFGAGPGGVLHQL